MTTRVPQEEARDRTAVLLAGGVIGALLLGVLLIPFRGHVSVSNLAFAFLALTILVAELGGRAAGLGTAIMSAMTLNFFLTEPYLTLRINKGGDLLAFVGLFVCGLIASAFGRRRHIVTHESGILRTDLDHAAAVALRLTEGPSSEAEWNGILGEAAGALGLRALVLRDETGAPVAWYGKVVDPSLEAGVEVDRATLRASPTHEWYMGSRGFTLDAAGIRIPLRAAGELVGRLDVWGDEDVGLSRDDVRALVITASAIGLELSRTRQAT